MNVRVINESGLSAAVRVERIEAAVDAELAKPGERLMTLIGSHWKGNPENVTSPWTIYKGVEYEAAPRN
jgi:hypothetical protein